MIGLYSSLRSGAVKGPILASESIFESTFPTSLISGLILLSVTQSFPGLKSSFVTLEV